MGVGGGNFVCVCVCVYTCVVCQLCVCVLSECIWVGRGGWGIVCVHVWCVSLCVCVCVCVCALCTFEDAAITFLILSSKLTDFFPLFSVLFQRFGKDASRRPSYCKVHSFRCLPQFAQTGHHVLLRSVDDCVTYHNLHKPAIVQCEDLR